MFNILSLNLGKPQTYTNNGKELHTGFIKHATNEAVWLSKTGLEGDGQADLKNHGGEDKALLMYPIEHYQYWQDRYQQTFEVPSFGENVTIEGITEEDVHIGDTFTLGDAVIQVSQPRNPCYKIAEVNQITDITAVVTETGYSGYYFRVLKEGLVKPTDTLQLKEADPKQIRVSAVQNVLFHRKNDVEKIDKILQVEALAASIRASLLKRLDKLSTN